jgi:uncharacterized protein (TIGR02996 family)
MTTAIQKLLAQLIAEGAIEAPKTAAKELAERWLEGRKNSDGFGEWLLEQEEVDELFVDPDQLDRRVQVVMADAAEATGVQRENRAAKSAHEPALAAAILEAPNDLDARAVYADWLIEQGDPRGELMMLQLGARTPKTRAREKEILALHRRHFFGNLPTEDEAGDDRVLVELENGFFATAIVPNEHSLRMLLDLESARFLTALELGVRSVYPIDPLLAERRLPGGLRSLKIGLPGSRHQRRAQFYSRTTCVGDINLGRALVELPHLESVEVRAAGIRIDVLPTPKLKELTLETSRLDLGMGAFDALTNLESLDITTVHVNEIGILHAFIERAKPARVRLPGHMPKSDES